MLTAMLNCPVKAFEVGVDNVTLTIDCKGLIQTKKNKRGSLLLYLIDILEYLNYQNNQRVNSFLVKFKRRI